jgi:hypothetical protein
MGFEYVSRLHLPDLFSQEPARRALHDMARHGGDAMLDYTIRNTPVDTRNLRTSWYQRPVMVAYTAAGHLAYESGVATDVEYAPYVEEGTGIYGPHHAKYRIRAKGSAGGGADFLRFVIGGRVIYAKEVWHPGSPGHHMVAIAAAMTEVQFDRILRPALDVWQHEQVSVHVGERLRSAVDFPAALGRFPGP